MAASYYVNCESAIELTNKHIGGYKLKELTPNTIQQYYDKLDRMKKIVTVVTAKPTLREKMNQTGIGYMKLRYEKISAVAPCPTRWQVSKSVTSMPNG